MAIGYGNWKGCHLGAAEVLQRCSGDAVAAATVPPQKYPDGGIFRAKPALFKTIQLKTLGGNFISSFIQVI
jgi:hypothetical protein